MMKIKSILFMVAMLISQSFYLYSDYICVIKNVYILKDGVLTPREENDKAIDQTFTVNSKTGEIKGYFGTDGFSVTQFKRPSGGFLSAEVQKGIVGDALHYFKITDEKDKENKRSFIYVKNWLHITGTCYMVDIK